jgi:Ku protein
LRQINRKTGNGLRQQLIDEETRDPIDAHDKGRGYEIGKGQFLLVEDEELEAIEIESTHTIDIDSFVPRSEIDQRFFDTPYYITPNDAVGQDAFAVIREAMRSKALVALGRIVLAKRERVMALEPYERGLLGTTLHYPYEVRNAKDYFADIPDLTPAPELLRLAEHILDSKLQAFDPSAFRDRYEEALMAHLKAKQAGMPPQPKQSWTRTPPGDQPHGGAGFALGIERGEGKVEIMLSRFASVDGAAPSGSSQRAYFGVQLQASASARFRVAADHPGHPRVEFSEPEIVLGHALADRLNGALLADSSGTSLCVAPELRSTATMQSLTNIAVRTAASIYNAAPVQVVLLQAF